jgi:UTP--glucose-1-phosphate uridylyltransferase
MDMEAVNAFHITGRSHDCGSKRGYMKANIEYGIRHTEIGEDFKSYLKDFVKAL